MFDNIKNFSICSSIREISAKNSSLLSRAQHTFIYRPRGSAQYTFKDNTIISNKYDLVFLPQGTQYYFSISDIDECWCSVITFDADIPDAKPVKFCLADFAEAEYIFSHFPPLWNFGNQSEKYKCYSMFYSLLSHLSYLENLEYANKKKFQLIDAAVDYLRDHIFDSSLKADSLHLLCGISDTYFRKIFTSRFSATPQDYIISKRMVHAKAIIDNGNFNTISDVATSVGYDDPLYFSRAFKKKYGISPIHMAKGSRNNT